MKKRRYVRYMICVMAKIMYLRYRPFSAYKEPYSHKYRCSLSNGMWIKVSKVRDTLTHDHLSAEYALRDALSNYTIK